MYEEVVWKLYGIAIWVMRLLYLNMIWILFTLLGCVIFGLFPATTAMFAVTRRWIVKGEQISVFPIFWSTYKTSFFQMNMIGALLTFLGIILYVDLRFFQTANHIVYITLSYFIIFTLFIYFVVVLYIFPLYVHYQYRTFEYIKRSVIIVLGKPLHAIMMIVGSYFVYLISTTFPILIIFISGSSFSTIIMWISMHSFRKNEISV